MRKFAEVPVVGNDGFGTPNVVRHIIEWEVEGAVPEFAENTVIAVEVTELDPQPEPGWTYDPTTGTFAPPEEE